MASSGVRALITGANRGIGLEITRRLQDRGYEVVAAVRTASEALKDLKVAQIVERTDVTDTDNIKALISAVGDKPFDIVINNAGILTRDALDNLDFDDITKQFQVNALGPVKMIKMLLDANLVKDGSKLAFVSSLLGSMHDNTSGKYYGYRMSKAALNAACKSLAIDLAPRNINVLIVHPGMVQTDMTGHNGIPVTESVDGIMARLDELNSSNSGKFWHQKGTELNW